MIRQVLVTGASKGIGRAIAIQLAKDAFTIVVHYMGDHAGAELTLAEIKRLGGEGRLIQFDIRDRQQCREVLEADIAQHGAYYGVVSNAGISRDTAFPAMSEEEWDGVPYQLGWFLQCTSPVRDAYGEASQRRTNCDLGIGIRHHGYAWPDELQCG